ncbi:MAPEG family protein [Roseibium sp. HPY-6]|uniref:MAPEG family protein n=1 Tax=Roseibium sp. HPY-6 TaxID=3229852 RepID=UPI00338DD460
MTTWILAVLVLYLCQIYFTAILYVPSVGLLRLAGGRDGLPEKGKLSARADRALLNLKENMPLFLVPALLVYVVPNANAGLAILGAQVFFWARLAYIPSYMSGIPGPRSIAYGAGLAGNLMIVAALFTG